MLKMFLGFTVACLFLQSPVLAIRLSGKVCRFDGQPLPAAVSLVGLSYKYPVGGPIAGSKDSAEFDLSVPAPGMYLLITETSGYERLEIPLLLDARGKKNLRLFPRQTNERNERVPICSDDRLVKWQAIHEAQHERHARYDREKKNHEEEAQKGTQPAQTSWPIDWQVDLQKLSQAIALEKDPSTRAFLAVCYMDLGDIGADLEQKMMPLILDLVPGDSPFWSINTISCLDVYNNANSRDANIFMNKMAERHPDPEVRAFALLVKILNTASEYDVASWRKLYRRIVTQYPATRAARSARKNYDPAAALANGQPFPSFQLTDVDSEPITLDTFKGKVLLVDFWATWCPPCVKEMPGIYALHEKYKKEGFEILSLAIDEKPEKIAAFREKMPMPWFHVLLAGGRSHPLPSALMVSTIPRAFLVGRDGKIIECKRALLKGERLEDTIAKAMRDHPLAGKK